MKVNVIMPVYNEERTLGSVIGRVLAQRYVDRLIIVDDHSEDGSLGVMRSWGRRSGKVSCLANRTNRGKGYSIRKGFAAVKKGLIIIQDADTEYYPEDYAKLLKRFRSGTAVYGSRMMGNARYSYAITRMANSFLTWLFNVLYGQSITDMNTCYKVFTKAMLSGIELRSDSFLIEPELSIKLTRKGYRITEARVRYLGRTYEEGKKIRVSDGIRQAEYMLAERFR